MSATRGYLTLATGSERFLELAVDMALSLREHTELPIAVATDGELGAIARERYSKVFDEVTRVSDRFLDGRGRKYGVAEASPFEETMFLDSDCFVLGPLDHLFDALTYTPLAMVGSQLTAEKDELHHGFSSRWLMRKFDLPTYMKTNSGLFCFRRSEAMEIMDECLDCFVREARPRLRFYILLGRWLGDEIAFGIVGARRELGMLPAPAPMYWPQEFESLDLDAPTKPLLHFIWPVTPAVLDQLLDDARHRRRAGEVPGDGTEAWMREYDSLQQMVKRRRFAERIGLH